MDEYLKALRMHYDKLSKKMLIDLLMEIAKGQERFVKSVKFFVNGFRDTAIDARIVIGRKKNECSKTTLDCHCLAYAS